MALQKQNLNINFAQGLDQKTDPFQVQAGKFLSLTNSIFDKAGRLTKRNGYGLLPALPDTSSTLLTTFNSNLTAIGNDLKALSEGSSQWIEKGTLQPIKLNTLAIARSAASMVQADSVIASNGLMCVVYTEDPLAYKYMIVDSVTSQNIVVATDIPDADATYGTPRVFINGSYFYILYTAAIGGTKRLRYISISTNNPTVVSAPTQIAVYNAATTIAFDALTVGSNLYIAYNTTTGGQSVKVTYISSTGVLVTATTFATEIATMFSISADIDTSVAPKIYVSYYDDASDVAKTLIVDKNLNVILSPTTISTGVQLLNLVSHANAGIGHVYAEVSNTYTFSAVETYYISMISITQAGTVGSPSVLIRDLGLASKAFTYQGKSYFLTVQSSAFQNTYFLISEEGEIIARLAYANAAPYYTTGLSNISVWDSKISMPYLYQATIQAASRAQGDTRPAIYAQLGINLVTFDFTTSKATSAEIGKNLNLTGGFLWAYDGVLPNENNFFLFPEDIMATDNNSGGSMAQQLYYYQVCYEWTDNQGNLIRSTPSLPSMADLIVGGGAGSITLDIPTLRLTYKPDVKIVIYRWSVSHQTYYQITSITAPLLNDPTVDSVQYIDTQADAAIIGNNILYTTGGVIENIAPPAPYLITLFDNRLWAVSSENRNLLSFSKQVIQETPVEMSDLLTIYAAPNTASQGSTGDITAIAPMDDKLIIWKDNALGYINGSGPDNTGANSQYSQFTLINSVVGCENQQSIVFTPTGLMFQSNKGIWLLGRDLSTSYIGADVETSTIGSTVNSAQTIPGTNQVRFTLDSGITLVYDYYFGQWSTFAGVPAISSTLYEDLHTYINKYGTVFQETPGLYLDATSPVLMSYTTSWFNLAGVQGYERFYQMYLLGQYLSPFKLNVQLAYDYNPSIRQATIVTPINPGPNWGGDQLWGSSQLWGGNSKVFEARVFPIIQKCESFQVTVDEVYDSTLGAAPGAGLTLSGMNLVAGIKKGYRTSSAGRSFG